LHNVTRTGVNKQADVEIAFKLKRLDINLRRTFRKRLECVHKRLDASKRFLN